MSSPLVYLSVHRIKEGRLEEFTAMFEETIGVIEAEERRTIAQEAWLDEDGPAAEPSEPSPVRTASLPPQAAGATAGTMEDSLRTLRGRWRA